MTDDRAAPQVAIDPDAAAQPALVHWWREPVAGAVSIIVGIWDTWRFGRDGGLSTSIDELLVIGGVVLIAGSRRLFTGQRLQQDEPKQ